MNATTTPPGPIETPADLRVALRELASDLAYSWDSRARSLFARLDPARFAELDHNPAALLSDLPAEAVEARFSDEDFRAETAAALARLRAERLDPTWWSERYSDEQGDFLVAYFCCEFGLDESLPIYAGGLGVLAGDHLKSASELGLPLVGVGLLYRRGYFRQTVDESGWQTERYPDNDPERLPVRLERGPSGDALNVAVPFPDGAEVRARIWRADVGRARLYLLDTDLDGNPDWARAITDALYGGDREHRIRQEVVVGIGGVRALRALGLAPSVFHMNEGHAAFLALERLRELTASGLSFDEAVEHVRVSTVFTTHTPVPAGNEAFDPALVQRYLHAFVTDELGLEWERFLALGRAGDVNGDPPFGMTPLALRTAAYANAVSELHGEVSRQMWRELWPRTPPAERPIGHVTNGVHARTWISEELEPLVRDGWEAIWAADDSAVWSAHEASKERLLDLARRRFARQGGDPAALRLDSNALTIGFARRFATYKRAGLLFSDPERLARLLSDPERPLQILLAGKAHPADHAGKELIQAVIAFTRDPRAAGRVVFLEDYEMTLARHLVQGVDVWLNTPRRPMEASGTSGMKAAMNGVLNCSTLDGWWCEGYAADTGFAIGGYSVEASEEEQDARDAEALFAVLEQQVLPAYYERDESGLPPRWVSMMEASIGKLGARFNTNRMVAEYAERYYLPAHAARRELDRTSR